MYSITKRNFKSEKHFCQQNTVAMDTSCFEYNVVPSQDKFHIHKFTGNFCQKKEKKQNSENYKRLKRHGRISPTA